MSDNGIYYKGIVSTAELILALFHAQKKKREIKWAVE